MARTKFPDWPRRRLEQVAVEHAAEVALAYNRLPGDAPADRLVVNMLRHEFTSYDADPTRENHRAMCEAIAARYPWLREECERQVRARDRREAEEQAAMEWAEAALAAGRAARKARTEESRRAISRFLEGMTVTATVRGHVREATVLKVGRTRLTIGFTIKTGASRTAVVYARDAEPHEARDAGPFTPESARVAQA